MKRNGNTQLRLAFCNGPFVHMHITNAYFLFLESHSKQSLTLLHFPVAPPQGYCKAFNLPLKPASTAFLSCSDAFLSLSPSLFFGIPVSVPSE